MALLDTAKQQSVHYRGLREWRGLEMFWARNKAT